MTDLLFLAHRLPFPPNKGDKITTYNMLRFLSQHYRVHLGCCVDDPVDWQYLPEVQRYCADTCFVPLRPRVARIKSLRGLLTGQPLTLPYYSNSALRDWVSDKIRSVAPQSILVFSGAMAQFLEFPLGYDARTVLAFEDVDSEKWRQYGASKRWPASWLYRREGRRLLQFERDMAARCDVGVFVSREEAELFAARAPEARPKVRFRTQGVDSDYFDPTREYPNPYPANGGPAFVFVGAMNYWPNVEAAVWFTDRVLPLVQRERDDLQFYIVGLNPTEEVRRLAQRKGIVVTGSVDDVRPYVAHAAAAVVPLQLARGIQNKVLEALAMARPVIATPQAMAGIDLAPGVETMIAEDPAQLAQYLLAVARAPLDNAAGREMILANYDWDRNLTLIADLLAGRPVDRGRLEPAP